jgi:hypothetical protein
LDLGIGWTDVAVDKAHRDVNPLSIVECEGQPIKIW